jgi:hypothetical protein
VHELTARHRRKAGSGPPANALIAWISADPHLRSVAASHRRETAASLPRHTRAAKAAVAACFALAGGAVLGITAIVDDGLVAPRASSPSPVLSQGAGPTGTAARGLVAGIQRNPIVSPTPAATQSMVTNQASQQADAGEPGPAGTLAPTADADDYSAVPTEPGKPASSIPPSNGSTTSCSPSSWALERPR